MSIRVGFGFDVHKLKPGTDFFLGGIKVEHHSGAIGHSDADTLIHAICDALLGALALGDIGTHFPDTDPAYRAIDSKKLLKEVMNKVKNHSYRVGNIDVTVALEKPKIGKYIPQMISILAPILELSAAQLSIKATTTEGLGFVGREEGVAVYAVALLTPLEKR